MSIIDICVTISVILVVLKLAGAINWSWLAVLFPLLFLSGLFIVVAIIVIVAAVLQ